MKFTRHSKLSISDKLRLLAESEAKNRETWAAFSAAEKKKEG